MSRQRARAGGPARPRDLPDWLFLIGRRPPGERRPVARWLADEAPHLLEPTGRPTAAFMAERRRRRSTELNGEGSGYFTRLYRPGDMRQPGDDEIDSVVPRADHRRSLGSDGPPPTSFQEAIAADLALRRGWQQHHDDPGRPIRTDRRNS